jgi:hypothetical protein
MRAGAEPRPAPGLSHAFGPYAAAVQRSSPPPPAGNIAPYPAASTQTRRADPAAAVPSAEPVADLRGWRQMREAQADVSLRSIEPAVASAQSPASAVHAPNVIALAPQSHASDPVATAHRPLADEPAMKVEAVERTVTFHVPTEAASAMPASLAAMLSQLKRPPALPPAAPAAPGVEGRAEPATKHDGDVHEPAPTWPERDDETATRSLASRLAPTPSRA